MIRIGFWHLYSFFGKKRIYHLYTHTFSGLFIFSRFLDTLANFPMLFNGLPRIHFFKYPPDGRVMLLRLRLLQPRLTMAPRFNVNRINRSDCHD